MKHLIPLVLLLTISVGVTSSDDPCAAGSQQEKNTVNVLLKEFRVKSCQVLMAKIRKRKTLTFWPNIDDGAIPDRVTNVDFVSKLPELVLLDITHQSVNDISKLRTLRNLKSLRISSNKLEDLSPIFYSKKLREILADTNLLKELEGVEKLKELHLMDISYNKIEDLRPLSNLKSLRILEATGNPIKREYCPTHSKSPGLNDFCSRYLRGEE